MRERFDAGTGLVAVGAVLLLVSLFIRWYDPGGDAWAVFESLDLVLAGAAVCGLLAVAPRFGTGGLGRALPIISVAAFAVVLVQLIDPPPVVRHSDLATGAWLALAATATMALGAILGAASISVTVDVRGRERRRRTAAIDARESAARGGRGRRGGRCRARAAGPSLRAPRRAVARAARAGHRRARGGSAAHAGPRPGRADTGVMSAVASGLSFEVLRFTVEPVSAEVALLELEGRFRAETRRRLGVPRLMAESDEGSREVAPAAASEAQAEPDGGLWRASYAVALEILDDGSFALAVGRELLVGLPAPDLAETSGEREVRLAREANALRRTADEARAAAAAALASVGTERQAREATEAEMAEARMARDDHARRAASLDDELAQLRREHAAELVRRDEEQAAALAGRDEEAARVAEERVAELEAEAAEARREPAGRARGGRGHAARPRARARACRGGRGRSAPRAGHRARRRAGAGGRRRRERTTTSRPRPWLAPTATRRWPPRAPRPTTTRPTSSIHPAGEPATEVAERPRRRPAPGAGDEGSEDATEVATRERRPGPVAGDPGETVRVLGARRPRRTGEGTPAEAAPGTAAIGARHIEPGQAPRRSAAAAWLARCWPSRR